MGYSLLKNILRLGGSDRNFADSRPDHVRFDKCSYLKKYVGKGGSCFKYKDFGLYHFIMHDCLTGTATRRFRYSLFGAMSHSASMLVGSGEGEGKYEELVGLIQCNCQLEAVLRITGARKKNAGRKFFACPKYSTDPSNCNFFTPSRSCLEWADELSGPGVPATHIPETPSKPSRSAARTSSKPREPSPTTIISVVEDVNINRRPTSQTISTPVTPESKPRDLAPSERRLAIIRAAFASESPPIGSPIVESTPRALDFKSNEGDVNNSESYPGNCWGDNFEPKLRSTAKPASTFKDNSSGLVTPGRTPGTGMIAENMVVENLSPKKRRIDMDDPENNPFLAKIRHPSAKSLDMSSLEVRITELVKEGVKEALSGYAIEQQAELRLLRGQVKNLQAKVEALENWRSHAESDGGTT